MKASECKCVECGKQAVAFYPCVDPDIPSHPYCRKCLDKEKQEAMMALFGPEQGRALFDKWNKENQNSSK